MWLAIAIVVALVTTQIVEGATDLKILHLWPGSLLAAGLMLALRCMNASQARASMDWEVFLCIAFAFAVSTAMEKTNVALAIAELFAALSEWNALGLLLRADSSAASNRPPPPPNLLRSLGRHLNAPFFSLPNPRNRSEDRRLHRCPLSDVPRDRAPF
jgi:hypothetical protein